MAYTALPATDVSKWDDDYKDLADDLKNETDPTEQAKLTAQMQSLAVKVEERLVTDINTVRRYSQTHAQTSDRLLAAALAELKVAKDTAGSFKKNPRKTELPPQIKFSIKKIAGFEQEFDNDSQSFGVAWMQYRAINIAHVPAKHVATFAKVRSEIMNADKPTQVKLQKLVAAKHEAEALLAVTDKAAMKKAIKAGTGTQRPIGDAQQMAKDIATQMSTMLDELTDPAGLAPKPRTIGNAKNALVASSKDPTYVSKPNALNAARGTWKNIDTAYKLMTTKAAAMEKVLATKTKGFRSNELTDATVKAELAKAQQKVKDGKSAIKAVDADYKAAQAAITKIEAAAKKKK